MNPNSELGAEKISITLTPGGMQQRCLEQTNLGAQPLLSESRVNLILQLLHCALPSKRVPSKPVTTVADHAKSGLVTH
ncbi:hypothetical protein M378DRAFT_164548 [Amanita muscaria Koide BX008]|uniref:Uncharacterized protein n=1 Tax=Amanita muscaria (strain Koide BX008) TaxID=946122 RepID=A0A0C2X401_AMAMK|nr:hypothetical protein M378DRAFT_164548 [Amanita muscaria Koide BX008]